MDINLQISLKMKQINNEKLVMILKLQSKIYKVDGNI